MAINKKVRKVLEDLLIDAMKDEANEEGVLEEIIRSGRTYRGVENLTEDELLAECENYSVAGLSFIQHASVNLVRIGDHVLTSVGWLEVNDLAVGGGEVTLISHFPPNKMVVFGSKPTEAWQVTVDKGARVRVLRMED
jgi:hypothetical protein